MKKYDNCPCCGTNTKDKFLNNVDILSQKQIDIINECHDESHEAYCEKCGDKLYYNYSTRLNNELQKLNNDMIKLIECIPVISTHSPLNWDYKILGMVTGQSTTGTGVLTEFTSSFSDLFGAQSGRHNTKLKKGEAMCFAQLRKQTLDLGGNAVIATDIDYSEVGSARGMLMVCMAGTAVNLNNLDVMGEDHPENMKELLSSIKRLNHINKLKS